MPSLNQPVLFGGRLQQAPAVSEWILNDRVSSSSLWMNSGQTNFTNIFPGTQDFCWETWMFPNGWFNQPTMICGWGSGGNAGNPSVSNFSIAVTNLDFDPNINVYLLGTTSTVIAGVPQADFLNKWGHIAVARIGSVINVWYNGTLVSQMTGVTADISYANIGGDGWWWQGGPVGDRDQTYAYGFSGFGRNMRYTIGNNVYGNNTTITPPSLTDNIPAVTGTQYIWWPASNSAAAPAAAPGGIWSPDYSAVTYEFQSQAGDSTSASVTTQVIAMPSTSSSTVYSLTPSYGYEPGPITPGTWTSNSVQLTTTGPTPVYGTSCGDFTASGTGVNITSSDTSLLSNMGDTLMYIWFYVPGNITNECKDLISNEVTDGFVLNIGKPGLGLDYLTVTNYQGTVLASAPHIWARNSWNFLVFQRDGSGICSAWAGAASDNYAINLNLVDSGASAFAFAAPATVSIGAKTGSTVSSQMYINSIQYYAGSYDGSSVLFANDFAGVPVQTEVITNNGCLTFMFQGTNGQTNIQPG